ncbi:hypothetical protein [Chryseobacterium sp. SIMBA_038]|uniref:hypothetical protein n=1 Tax=Chryseobacterium sp. SIMBA_038 TaxID=3085780 RepID=UPI00397A1ECD
MIITNKTIKENTNSTEVISRSLSHIEAYDRDKDFGFWLMLYCINLNLDPYAVKLIERESYNEFDTAKNYFIKALDESMVSKYQKTTIINITNILCEAKILRDVGELSAEEFVQIFLTVRTKILQKFLTVQNNYLKGFGITKNSLYKLRARVATLQNEN